MPRKAHYYKVFPSLLWSTMQATNISQAELSRKLRMSPSAVSEWLSGKRCPRIAVVRRLAKLFHLPVAALTGTGRPDNLVGRGALRFQAVPVFQVAAGDMGGPKRLRDLMNHNYSRTFWECRLCGNRYELDEMEACPNDGEPRPGPADPLVVARKRVERIEISGRPTREEIERQASKTLDELQAEGILSPEARTNTYMTLMARFEAWLQHQAEGVGEGAPG